MSKMTPFNPINSNYPNYPGGPATTNSGPNLDIMKYVAAFRDRIWIFLGLFVVVAAGVYFAMMSVQPLYKAQAMVQILRQEESRTNFNKVSDESVRSTEDINTQIQLLSSFSIIDSVAERVEADFKEDFLDPYRAIDQNEDDLSIIQILADNRKIAPARLSLIVSVEYSHPNPEVAARVANLFSQEMALYYSTMRNDAVTRAVQDLREQAEIQRRKVENIEKQLIDFKEDLKTISFDQRLDIDQQEMVSLKTYYTQKSEVYDRLRTQWAMLEDAKASGKELHSLSFIANSGRVSNILGSLAGYRIEVARLSERYRAKHPSMIEAQEGLQAAQRELAQAIEEETNLLKNQLLLAEQDLQKASGNVDAKKNEIIAMQRHAALYDSKARELAVNQNLYEYLYNRIQETETQKRDDINKIRIIDEAMMPAVPYTPQKLLSIAAALMGGMAVASGVVILLIFLDDHVKSHADVENKLGLPIIGMLGLIRGSPQTIGDLSKATAADPQNSEMLNAIIASLRLDPVSANAKTILVTSTISNEGKSYVSSSLASAFQRFGEKTILINCDLRAREDRLQLISGQGLVPYLESEDKSLKSAIYHSQHLDCDVMPAGGFHSQPYRLYTTDKFKQMLADLSTQYDRIIIDTPPTHLFGDSLSLLPLCDGQIFVSGFARARISLATKTVKRLRETGCPIFGAVINGVKTFQAKMYYPAHYQENSTYSDYGKGKKKAAQY